MFNGVIRSALILTLSLSVLVPPLSAGASPADTSLTAALAEFPAARKGDAGATKRTYARLKEISKHEGGNSLFLSFFGCTTAMMARHTSAFWKKSSYAKDGAKLLDHAVKSSPADAMVRLVRASTYVLFPSALGKDPLLREDIAFLQAGLDGGHIPADQADEARKVLVRYFHRTGDTARRDQFFGQITDSGIRKDLAASIGKS